MNKNTALRAGEENVTRTVTFKNREHENFYAEVIATYQISQKKSTWIYANVTNYRDNLVSQGLVVSAIFLGKFKISTNLYHSILKPYLQVIRRTK